MMIRIKQSRRNHRQCDFIKHLEPAGIIQRRRFINAWRYALQGRHDNQGVIADSLPDRYDNDGYQCGLGALRPCGRRESHQLEEIVEKSLIRLHQPQPDQRDRHDRNDVRRKIPA